MDSDPVTGMLVAFDNVSLIPPAGRAASGSPVSSGIMRYGGELDFETGMLTHISQNVCPFNGKTSRELAENSPFKAPERIAGKDALRCRRRVAC
jgi:hypothetical protein